ncbi:hypothetical protein L1987_33707 [Smallanthus sonchifolius]|uniref:Uncharacterized protein n=2 Tax=Smallanthus sonchifolius TaxID=185202 RepID=A0ACB9HUD8_9ASTR|nr:hypothetical protein L1987_33705 [Smallanthus sonchifolius]KAI3798432.1 hypothetical protein L1987_33707 [Smallanthus sonchifolius]
MSKIRSYSSFEARTGSHAIVQPTEVYDNDDGGQTQALSIGAMAACRSSEVQLPDTSYSNEQAPSMGFMVGDRGDSQPGGGNFSYGAPPWHTDVARRDESQNGESGGVQYLSEENYERMSLTGRDFARLYPTMYP